jgi:hypothetical protein
MTEKTIQNRIITKQHQLEYACKYGLTHFCDGKPNKSVDEHATPKPRCPKYWFCDLRKHSIYDERSNFDD